MDKKRIAKLDRLVSIKDENGNRVTRRVSELMSEPYLVLLGEPGMGKSTVFEMAAEQHGVAAQSVRELITLGTPKSSKRVFADSFDEYRSDGDKADKIWMLAKVLEDAADAGWWLSCRVQDWREVADSKVLSKITKGARLTIATLEPLGRHDAFAILEANGVNDASGKITQIEAIGAAAFLENPLSIVLLTKILRSQGTLPQTRFDLYQQATLELAREHNDDYSLTERASTEMILQAAGRTCLTLLLTGAPAVWRANTPPPAPKGGRPLLTASLLQLESKMLGDTLGTPIFRGEEGAFAPFHKSIAEFLGAQALAKAVVGSKDNPAFPLRRALALICGPDGGPPSVLRGLFAWFAAHLAKLGEDNRAADVIARDPYSVLSYGDAAAFNTALRRVLLEQLDRDDPFPWSSSRGETAFGGLAGEDLAPEIAAILQAPKPGNKLYVVFSALETGKPVPSLRDLLRSIALDPAKPGWQRSRAAAAWLNGAENADTLRRELFDALDGEPESNGREVLRVDLAASMPVWQLSLDDLRSVLVGYEQHHDDRVSGGLYRLQRHLMDYPRPELFDVPVSSWRPDPGHGNGFDIDYLLRRALAAAIMSDPAPSASRLRCWLGNVGHSVGRSDEVRKSVRSWLDASSDREIAFLDALLAKDDSLAGAWMTRVEFIDLTGRFPSSAMCRHVLACAEKLCRLEQGRYAEIATYLAQCANSDGYWLVYEWLATQSEYGSLLRALTVCDLENWRLEERERLIEGNRAREERRVAAVQILEARMDLLRAGEDLINLGCAAQLYFGSAGPDIERVVRSANRACTDAMIDGWKRLLLEGSPKFDPAFLGRSHAKGEVHAEEYVFQAATDVSLHNSGRLEPDACSLVTAISLLHCAYINVDEARRTAVERFAIDRLNLDANAGSAALVEYWRAALDGGADTLETLWTLTRDDVETSAVTLALDALLATRPDMDAKALYEALGAATGLLVHSRLLELAIAAEANPAVKDEQSATWRFVRFALDPTGYGETYAKCFADTHADRVWRSALCSKLLKIEDNAVVRADAVIRLFGPRCEPQHRFAHDGHRSLAEPVAQLLNDLTVSTEPQARLVMAALAREPSLAVWKADISHGLAQSVRAARDRDFRHPAAEAVTQALAGQEPVNAQDLRAILTEELDLYRRELRTASTTPWKKYWGPYEKEPHTENQCRNMLVDDLQNRLKPYKIAAVLPEALRADDTRADFILLSGAGRNLPLEAKRHSNKELWTAAQTQLQGYAADPGADGFGVYLVFWFGIDWEDTPSRGDKASPPKNAEELRHLLAADLPEELRERTDVVVLDLSRPKREPSKKPGRRKKAKV